MELYSRSDAFGKNTTKEFRERQITAQMESSAESFDISGKVDTNNPIYRFYEKDLAKYLKSKYNAELVTDSKGVKWIEVKIDKRMGNEAVEAFGKVGISPLFGIAGASALGAIGAGVYKSRKEDK